MPKLLFVGLFACLIWSLGGCSGEVSERPQQTFGSSSMNTVPAPAQNPPAVIGGSTASPAQPTPPASTPPATRLPETPSPAAQTPVTNPPVQTPSAEPPPAQPPPVQPPPAEPPREEPPPAASAPRLAFRTNERSVDRGSGTILLWSAVNADTCTASGGWSGPRATTGSESTGELLQTRSFRLACSGTGGRVTAVLVVEVGVPGESPSVTMQIADSSIDRGGRTTLSWASTNATGCSASGGWSGSRSTSGSETVGPITSTQSYTLTCSGSGGNAVAMTSVAVNGAMSASWIAPTENVDGTPLTDLRGFRIYYGTSPRNYTDSVAIDDPAATSITLAAPQGDYYVAMTALDMQGNESAYSNEVRKRAQ